MTGDRQAAQAYLPAIVEAQEVGLIHLRSVGTTCEERRPQGKARGSWELVGPWFSRWFGSIWIATTKSNRSKPWKWMPRYYTTNHSNDWNSEKKIACFKPSASMTFGFKMLKISRVFLQSYMAPHSSRKLTNIAPGKWIVFQDEISFWNGWNAGSSGSQWMVKVKNREPLHTKQKYLKLLWHFSEHSDSGKLTG